MSHSAPNQAAASSIHTVAEAGAYIVSVCFKHGPPERTGIELEWLLHDPSAPNRRPDTATLVAALGPHAPRTIDPNSPAAALPAGGLVTVEPGGQLEISSAPATSIAALIDAMHRDVARLQALLEPTGFQLSGLAADSHRRPERLLHTPRYDAMASAFDAIGPAGRQMMCSTAATQVCVDLGPPGLAEDRWRAAHYLGPVLLAAFANSPQGWPELPGSAVSQRMASWWQLDPRRTEPPGSFELADYVRRALDTQVLARQRERGSWQVRQPLTLRQWLESGKPVTTADIDLHLSMIFPPVRPQGYLELRYLDAQPAGEWIAPLCLIAALFDNPAGIERVLRCCAATASHWQQATEAGLADPALRDCAGRLLAVVGERLPGLGLPDPLLAQVERLLQRRLGAAISPALDELSAGVGNQEVAR